MALDRLTQITSSGISSTSTITVSAIAGVITATSVTVGSAVTINSSGINAGVVTATSFRVGTGGTIIATTDGGSIGIGTTLPTVKLHVNNGSAIISIPTTGSGGSVLLVTDEGTATTVTGGATLRVSNDGSASNFAVFEASSTSSNFVITNAGNIGIGTTNPTDKLSIYSAPNSLVLGAKDTTRGNHIFQLLANNASGDGELRLYKNSASGTHEKTVEIASTGNSYFTGGNVGIGTTNPSSVLNIIGGSIPVKINNTASDGLQIIRQSKTLGLNANYDNADTHCLITASSGMDLAFATNGDFEKVRITGIGSVGIGLTNPNARLTIKSSGANTIPLNIQNSGNTSIFKISQSTGGSGILELRDSTDKTYMIADTSSGFVGVGTANPDSIFQVGSGPDAIVNGFSNSRLVVSDSGNTQADVFVRNHVNDVMCRLTAGPAVNTIGSISNHQLEFCINNTTQVVIDTSGNLVPSGDANKNLGSSANRWANIFSADLQLSNEGSKNDVDGTWGKYTIQEGENDLFLINRRTGKKYKFLLEEVQ